MTDLSVSTIVAPVPMQPWRQSRAQRTRKVATLGAASLLSLGVVLASGLAGLDGWALAFFFTVIAFSALGWRGSGRLKITDGLVTTLIASGAVVAFIPWLSVFLSLLTKGFQGLYFGFFVRDMRVTTVSDELDLGGAGHAIIGSLIMVLIATAITLPLGILSGVYLTEVRGRMSGLVRFVVQSMSGIPSIVAGLFIYTTFVTTTHSFSGFAGALALSILMLPTVARTSEEVLKLVPEDLRAASYALGARQWRSALFVILPTVRSGLTTAAILGVARIVGETAPLLLTSLANNEFVFNPFSGPIASLPTYIFGSLQIGSDYAVARAWTGALILMTIVFILFVIARRVGGKDRR